jgi:acetone carboxylase gamma subunit
MVEVSKEVLRSLVEGKLPWPDIKAIMSAVIKDSDRFEKYIEILQERVSWKERILLPIGLHLFIVEKENGDRIVKCECGYEFGDYRVNWKLQALIYVRDDEEKLEEIYPGFWKPDPEIWEIREFYCPECATLLEVESVPKGYPLIFDFLPDIDSFYSEWLNKPLKTFSEFEDRTYEFIKKEWGGEEVE